MQDAVTELLFVFSTCSPSPAETAAGMLRPCSAGRPRPPFNFSLVRLDNPHDLRDNRLPFWRKNCEGLEATLIPQHREEVDPLIVGTCYINALDLFSIHYPVW